MPDALSFLLPGRAYLLSLRDQNLPMRRAALEDAEATFWDMKGGSVHDEQLAVVAVVGEALQIVEDVAALSNSFLSTPEGVGFYATAASYNPRSINNFYSSLKKRPVDEVLALAGLRFAGIGVENLVIVNPPLSDEERAAIEEAHLATARFIRECLLILAENWGRFRRYFHAYKHGLIVANPGDVSIVEDRNTDIEGIVVWVRKKPDPLGVGLIEPPFEDAVEYLGSVGRAALDLLEHFTESRLRVLELVALSPDGSWTFRPTGDIPWLWWFDEPDVSRHSRQLLEARFGILFE